MLCTCTCQGTSLTLCLPLSIQCFQKCDHTSPPSTPPSPMHYFHACFSLLHANDEAITLGSVCCKNWQDCQIFHICRNPKARHVLKVYIPMIIIISIDFTYVYIRISTARVLYRLDGARWNKVVHQLGMGRTQRSACNRNYNLLQSSLHIKYSCTY